MKKLLSLLLAALVMLAPVCAMAADASYETYGNEANGYSIDYPAEWTILSKETLQSVMDAISSGEKKVKGMDSAVVESYNAQIQQMDMAMFMSEDGAINSNVTYMAVPEKYSGDVIISSVYPVVLQQVKSAYLDYEAIGDHSNSSAMT